MHRRLSATRVHCYKTAKADVERFSLNSSSVPQLYARKFYDKFEDPLDLSLKHGRGSFYQKMTTLRLGICCRKSVCRRSVCL